MATKPKLDALIINPSALSEIYQDLGQTYTAIEPPIWAALIANHLRSKNYSVELLDCEGLGITASQAAKQVGDLRPKLTIIVVYGQQPSASTQNMHAASLMTNALKDLYPDGKILLVGGHVSALPKQSLLSERADFVCQGEGPVTIRGLLAADMNDTTQLANVPGLWFKDGDLVRQAPPAAVIPQEELNHELPGLAWDLLPMKNYRAHNWHSFADINARKPYASIYTSLGCPFRCTFCCINAPFGKSSFRYWEPEFIIKQFDTLAGDYGVKNIKIADEMFVLHDRHFIRLCELIKERGYGFNIWAYSRIDTVKVHHLQALKDAGVNWLALGIESKSQFVRNGVAKGRFGEQDIPKIVKQIKDVGINVIGNYIFGLPDDNFDTMNETLTMALELNCEMANFYSAMAYPGSQLYDIAIENQWLLPNSWLGYSQHAVETLPLPTKFISSSEVLAFRDKAFGRYFSDANYLKMILAKFGENTHQHIVEMSKHKLERKYAATLADTHLNY